MPATWVTTTTNQKKGPGDQPGRRKRPPSAPKKAVARKNPWKAPRAMPPMRVYWLMMRRPSSPSLESFSSAGTTVTRICMMMAAVM